MESDEEREKAAKKAKRGKRTEHVSGDEGVEGEPKPKKRRGKLKKSADSGAENEDEALFSGEDEEQKPKKVGTFRCLLVCVRLDTECVNINSARRSELSGTMTKKSLRQLRLVRSNSQSLPPCDSVLQLTISLAVKAKRLSRIQTKRCHELCCCASAVYISGFVCALCIHLILVHL